MESLAREISSHLDDDRRGEIVRSGLKVAIFGPPNAGKVRLSLVCSSTARLAADAEAGRQSSLLNHLAKRDAAIVSDVPGTTRDVITVSLDLDGVKLVLSDTAGLRATSDKVERIGVDRAREE